MSDEPIVGGLYRFAEPQNDCWVPIDRDHEVSAALLAEAGYSYGALAAHASFGEQIRRVHDLRPTSTEWLAELREAALRAGRETADPVQAEAEETPS